MVCGHLIILEDKMTFCTNNKAKKERKTQFSTIEFINTKLKIE